MKKNTVMRMLSLVLVLTLISTCAISGTFAKYVTSDSAKDTARVAKFGVLASIEGNLFGETYDSTGKIISYGETTPTVSADAASTSASSKVVAPGTHGDKLTFSVQGEPEVSTAVTFGDALTDQGISVKAYDSDIVLAAGDYGVMVQWTGTVTNESVIGKYTKAESGIYTEVTSAPATLPTTVYELKDAASVATNPYYPLDWYVGADASDPDTSGTIYKTVFDAKGSLDDAFVGKTFNPNTSNALSQYITWDWDFEEAAALSSGSIYYDNDKADTILGDMIAEALSSGTVAVVVKTGSGTAKEYTTLKYVQVPVGATDSTTSAYVAYIGTAPSTAPVSAAQNTALPQNMFAVLTVNFQASLTVTQVD